MSLLLDEGCDTLLRNNLGNLAVEYFLLSLQAQNGSTDDTPRDEECGLIGRLFKDVEERQLGSPRPMVLLLKLSATDSLLLQVAKKTLEPQRSYGDQASILSPLEASCRYSCSLSAFQALVTNFGAVSESVK